MTTSTNQSHPGPTEQFPDFYTNSHITSGLAPHRLWTVSDSDKRPVDIVATLDTSPVCPRCHTPGCTQIHGATLTDAATQLLTLDELTARLPNAANVATHLDWHTSGLMVLDIEPDCPPEVTDQLLRLVTGNDAGGPAALYSELSGSGRGYHLLMPTPANAHLHPSINSRLKVQHPQRWYEILFYHWITFSRTPIPAARLDAATARSTGDNITWEAVFDQLLTQVPASPQTGPAGSTVNLVENLSQVGQQTFTAVEQTLQTLPIRPIEDFHGDTSRWEMSCLNTLAAATVAKHETFSQLASMTRMTTPDDLASEIAALVYRLAQQVLPERDKHHQIRDAMPYLAWRSAQAAVDTLARR